MPATNIAGDFSTYFERISSLDIHQRRSENYIQTDLRQMQEENILSAGHPAGWTPGVFAWPKITELPEPGMKAIIYESRQINYLLSLASLGAGTFSRGRLDIAGHRCIIILLFRRFLYKDATFHHAAQNS